MKKALSVSLILAVMISGFTPTQPAYAYTAVPITAPSAVLLDYQTHRLVYSKTPNLQRAPASTTKLLTAMVAMDMLALNKVVTIPTFVRSIQPSKIYLKPGERYYVRDLIKATLINSANDAAEVLAVASAGSRAAFAKRMNAKVRSLGCYNSHFMNASGLPAAGQYSTAYDMARIMRALQRYPYIVSVLKIKTGVIYSRAGRKIFLKNHNKMLWRDHREVIGKTGWTRKAKHCFVGHILVNGQKVFVAMLGSHRLWRDLKILVDYQFGKSISPVAQNRKIWGRDETKRIQRALVRAGYKTGPIDGVFGGATVSAVRNFQRAHGLSADGVVGDYTWKKLQSYL